MPTTYDLLCESIVSMTNDATNFADMQMKCDNVGVGWTYLNEGYDGDYDPNDPDDKPLLRFDVWCDDFEVLDASYCTHVPATTDRATLQRMLSHIMNAVFENVHQGKGVKKICERLSWINPSDFK